MDVGCGVDSGMDAENASRVKAGTETLQTEGYRSDLNHKGIATVEYAVIMPLLILLVILLLFIVFTLHDRSVLQSSTTEMAESIARVWRCGGYPQDFMNSGDWSPESRDVRTLYWQLGTALSEDKGKTERIETMMAERLQNRRWLPKIRLTDTTAGDVQVTVSSQGGIPFATLHVETILSRSVPAARFMSRFGWDGVIHIRASADVLISDPKALIQDVDWGLQILQKTGAGKLYGKIANPIRIWYGKAVLVSNGKTEVR